MSDFNVFDVYGLEIFGRRLESPSHRLTLSDIENRKLWATKPAPVASPTAMPTSSSIKGTTFTVYFTYKFDIDNFYTLLENLLETMYENMVSNAPLPPRNSMEQR